MLPSSDRSSTAQTATVAVLNTTSLVLFAAVAAFWTWQWLAPPPTARLPALDAAGTTGAAAANLFGTAAVETVARAASGIEIQLLGSVAATAGRTGYALLRTDSRQTLTVKEGDEILPGIRLAAVAADHVEIERNGVREILAWPVSARATAPAAAGKQ